MQALQHKLQPKTLIFESFGNNQWAKQQCQRFSANADWGVLDGANHPRAIHGAKIEPWLRSRSFPHAKSRACETAGPKSYFMQGGELFKIGTGLRPYDDIGKRHDRQLRVAKRQHTHGTFRCAAT
jgi:hypothetical protein